jgi:O-antigen/teichoic acid export membrane protein
MSLSLEAGLALKTDSRLKPISQTAWRYILSALGPVATSGAHFLASLLFVRSLPAAQFGLFSFVLVIVPFAMSMTASLLVVPVTRSLAEAAPRRALVVASCLKLNAVLALATALVVFFLLLFAHATLAAALPLGLFGGAFTSRWFVRCFAFVEGRTKTAVACDLVYSATLMGGLGLLAFAHALSLTAGGFCLLAAALASMMPAGRTFFAAQWSALFHGRLSLYAHIFRDVTRWALMGVVLTEMTVNAHAYLVTFISGSGSFALLALGMLLLRPASLVQSALPDLELPRMTRQIAARDWRGLTRTRREFGVGLMLMLLATLALDGGLLAWYPALILKKGYGLHAAVVVTAICGLIMAVRALRTPPAVEMQAAGSFRELAFIGTKSSVISLLATLALLLAFGPLASLGGVLCGEVAMLVESRRLMRRWELAHV